DGRIRLDELLALLDGRRLAPPGERYSYSNAGAWIASAVLEALEHRRFGEQLRDDLLASLGIQLRHLRLERSPGDGAVCPAMGGSLSLSVVDMLTFLETC